MPDAFIGIDIIAGARGETDDEWLKGLEFVDSLPVTRLHVFPYSERPGTKALQLAHAVSQEEKHRRVAELMKISERKHASFIAEQTGKEAKVLWEAPHHGAKIMHGWTENYIRVEAPYRPELVNMVTTVTLNKDIISDEQ